MTDVAFRFRSSGAAFAFMGIGAALVLSTASTACSGGSESELDRPSSMVKEKPMGELGYAWDQPVTEENFGTASETKLGTAHDAIVGHTLGAIVTDPNVHVRGDDKPCVACHAWSQSTVRAEFCARVPQFVAMPTSKGDGTDPPNAKPAVLKTLLQRWFDHDCP